MTSTSDPARAIDEGLVRRLLEEQFPQWADLTIRPVVPQGWDNRTFRLGEELIVRLPSAAEYAPQVEKEQRWLPHLAQNLPLPIPHVVAQGRSSPMFPWSWSIYGWIDGHTFGQVRAVDLTSLAVDLGKFLCALRQVPNDGGPVPGQHSGFRGADFSVYADEAMQAVSNFEPDARRRARDLLHAATASKWTLPNVWVHGDIATDNLLFDQDGRLCAVIDFGCAAVGDPACDLVPAWTIFDEHSRPTFMASFAEDEPLWQRARGWAMWKSAITLGAARPTPAQRLVAERTMRQLLLDSRI